MTDKKCCENCKHYQNGICKEYEALVGPNRDACGWYCRKVDKND